ncbi:Uncharacterised protein [Bordetella pertussis]|nr:Uncharacterised protein [Bordetella pertussis]CFM16328.1 Uncharacterised protein [Bordetella pertussis]CFM65235.1 Uncharacterised protein [Bordetella pertussis]CFM88950.1 Uncharacterised protein [Bordetella pertussis]CFN68466.1 Uncharacterised protein [Bordetella pertussis]
MTSTRGTSPTIDTGTRSSSTLYGMLGIRLRPTASGADDDDSNRVYPSAADFAVASVPITPPAPARFCTTTGWPSESCSVRASTRAITSVLPPGGNGTIIWIGRAG